MIGCAPCANPITGIVKNCITLDMMTMALTYKSPPYDCIDVLKAICTRLSVLCMINGDSPSASTLAITRGLMRRY